MLDTQQYIEEWLNYNFSLTILLFRFTGTTSECVNLGSYNYLGFAEANGKCADQSIETLKKFGCASCSSRLELGN